MRWNDGDIDLDADELSPDDLDAGQIDCNDGDSPCDLEWEKSLLSEWVERLKDLDISFPVPVLDLSCCDEIEATAVAWLKSPRLMLETLAARLNEVIERCKPLPVHGLVLELKRECYSLPGLSDLYNLSCTLHSCGSTVDYVNSIQPTPLKGEILVQLGKSVLPGRTQELNRCINCCKRELTKLAKWIKIKDIHNTTERSAEHRQIELTPPLIANNQTQSEATNGSPEIAEPTTTASDKAPEPTGTNPPLVSPEDVALKLKALNITIAVKTLKNSRTREWGEPDGFEGNAYLFDWNRIQPIVERQFNVKFDN